MVAVEKEADRINFEIAVSTSELNNFDLLACG